MDDDETVFGTDFGLDSDEETKADEKLKRTFQSEQDFLVQKRSWTPKLENKEVIHPAYPPFPLPLSPLLFSLLLLPRCPAFLRANWGRSFSRWYHC